MAAPRTGRRSRVPRDLEPRRGGQVTWARREGGVRADDGPAHRPARARPRDARLPLRGVRADRARPARPAPRRRARRRSTGCSAAASSSTCSRSSARACAPASRATRSSASSRCTRSSARSSSRTPAAASSRSRPGSSWAPRRRRQDGRGDPATGSPATTATTSSSNWRLRDWLEERRAGPRAARGDAAAPPGDRRRGGVEGARRPRAARSRSSSDRLTAGVARRPGRPCRRTRRGGPLAARPAARLAPARGQGGLVALLRADGHDRRRARRRARAARPARAPRRAEPRQAVDRLHVLVPGAGPPDRPDIDVDDPRTERGRGRRSSRSTTSRRRSRSSAARASPTSPLPRSLVPQDVMPTRSSAQSLLRIGAPRSPSTGLDGRAVPAAGPGPAPPRARRDAGQGRRRRSVGPARRPLEAAIRWIVRAMPAASCRSRGRRAPARPTPARR